jgi:hypothetical protein
MTWDKPKTSRQWLTLFVPAGICVLSTLAGGLLQPKDGDWMGWAIVGLLIATLISFVLSIRLARVNPSPGGKIGCALVCFAILMAVNGAVSFAGCAVGWSTLPTMNFH